MTHFKIGDVARILGVTTQALRYFEKEGVVRPEKSSTGTRYYSVNQLVQLLSFKKYRQADFSVQDIVEHFQEDSLSSLSERMALKQRELEEESRILRLRADAVGLHHALLGEIMEGPEIRRCMRPALRVLHPEIARLASASGGELEDFSSYMNSMPAAHVSFSYAQDNSQQPRYHLCIREEDAVQWALPARNTCVLPAAPCLAVKMRFDVPDGDNPLAALSERLSAAGYDIAPEIPFFGVHIASETHAGKVRLYAKVFADLKE